MALLVAYGTKHGSTREVAEELARKLAEGGREVELRRAGDVEDLKQYDTVVLGGSLYFGRWHADAARFLAKHQGALAELRVAVFALGPTTAEPQDLAESRAQLDKTLRKAPEVVPSSVAVFGGVIDPTKLRFPLSRMPASDARDWDTIDAWAEEIAATT
jgi:menaquinone-dependent protoporphyrinogen oxidase